MNFLSNKKSNLLPIIIWNVLFWKVLYTKLFEIFHLSALVSSSIVIITISSFALLTYYLLVNKVPKDKAYFIPIVCSVVLVISSVFFNNGALSTYLSYFFRYTLLLLLVFPSIYDADLFLKTYGFFAVVVFIVLGFQPIVNPTLFQGYMDYGFSVALPCYIGIVMLRRTYHHRCLVVLEILCLVMLLIYSNRGAFLSALVFLILVTYFATERTKRKKRLSLVFALVVLIIIYFTQDSIIALISSFLSKVGYNSYSFNKYVMYLNGNMSSSAFWSGRDQITQNVMEYIKNNLFFGMGVGTFETMTGDMSHNIFLDFMLYWGLFGLVTIMCIVVYTGKTLLSEHDNRTKNLMLVLLCLWFPKLLLSGNFIYESAFWCFFSFCVSVRRRRRSEISYD